MAAGRREGGRRSDPRWRRASGGGGGWRLDSPRATPLPLQNTAQGGGVWWRQCGAGRACARPSTPPVDPALCPPRPHGWLAGPWRRIHLGYFIGCFESFVCAGQVSGDERGGRRVGGCPLAGAPCWRASGTKFYCACEKIRARAVSQLHLKATCGRRCLWHGCLRVAFDGPRRLASGPATVGRRRVARDRTKRAEGRWNQQAPQREGKKKVECWIVPTHRLSETTAQRDNSSNDVGSVADPRLRLRFDYVPVN